MIQCVAMVKDWSKQDKVLIHLKSIEAMVTWYKGRNFVLIVYELSGKKIEYLKKEYLKTENSKSPVPQIWLHVDIIWKNFKYAKPSPISNNSDLEDVRCRLDLGFLKFSRLFQRAAKFGETYSRWCYILSSEDYSKMELTYHVCDSALMRALL